MSNLKSVWNARVRLRDLFPSTCFIATVLLASAIGFAVPQARAADTETGTIEGRVLNLGTGQYLSSAAVKVAGTSIMTITNEYGEFTLRNVPVGSRKITATFSGQEPATMDVKVEAGKSTTQDIGMNKGNIVLEDGTMVLDAYTVSDNRFKNAQEIAINEERRSVNAKDVVSTDSLGHIPGGNIGEFVKYIPGVQTEYGGTDAFSGAGLGGMNPSAASQVSIRGFGAAETSITIDGMSMSGVGPGALTRAVGLDMMSINNASRIEVIKVPTPDMDAGAGGAVNLVTKSAFEYAKPTYSAELSATYNTSDNKIFAKQAGPANKKTYHTLPSGSISVAVPVSKDFGFSVSVAAANAYSANYKIQASWQNTYSTALGSRTAQVTTTANDAASIMRALNSAFVSLQTVIATTTGSPRAPSAPYDLANWTTVTASFAFNTSTQTLVAGQVVEINTYTARQTVYYNVGNIADGRLSTLANPFLRQATDNQNPWSERKVSAAVKLDWKPVKGMFVSGSYTGSTYKGINVDRRLQMAPQAPIEWGSTYVIGRPYENAITGVRGALDAGRNSIAQEVTARDKSGVTHTGYLKMNYAFGPWSVSGSASRSRTRMDLDDLKNGHMYKVAMGATVGQVIFRDIKEGVPGVVEVYDRNGVAINYKDISKWSVDGASTTGLDVGLATALQTDLVEEYKFDVKRDLDFLPFTASFKVGGSRKVKEQSKSGLGTGYKMRYTGTDSSSASFVESIRDNEFTRTSGLGFAVNQQWADPYKMYSKYVANPELFDPNYNITYTTGNYRESITSNKMLRETADAMYAMIEGSFFNNRLSFVTGVRQSYSKVYGRQPYTDPRWNYAKNRDGTLYRDSFYLSGVKFDGSSNVRTDVPEVPATATTLRIPAITTTLTTATVSPGVWNAQSNVFLDSALMSRMAAAGARFPDHLILGPGVLTGTTGNNMEAARLGLFTTELRRRRTNPITPSISVSYNITDDLVFKPSWGRETSMPPLDGGNGGTSGLLGGVKIEENQPRVTGAGGDGLITISNAGLRPKVVDSWNFQLAWYNKYGKLGATFFYKTINNEWIKEEHTYESSEFETLMNDNGFDPYGSYRNWTLNTTYNSNERSQSTGYELEGRENLGFLGNFMSNFNVFGNYSHKNIKQANRAGVVAMTAFAEDVWSGGLNISAYRTQLTVRVIYNNELWDKTGTIDYILDPAVGISKIQLYNVTPANYKVKVDLDYQLTKMFTFFITGDNITNTERRTIQRDAMGIKPEYSWVTSNYQFGVNITAGVRAQF